MVWTVRNGISGVSVVGVADACENGDGTLTAETADSLSWTAPGGSAGDAVEIANGEIKALYDGDDADQWIMVKRTSAVDLEGEATVVIAAIKNLHDRIVEYDEAITKATVALSEGVGDMRLQRQSIDYLEKKRAELWRTYAHQKGMAPMAAEVDMRLGD